MKITDIRTHSVKLEGAISNAVVSFDDHDVSLVAIVSDVMRGGRPVVGFGFNSIGRYAQRGILLDRIRPRILAATPDSLLGEDGCQLDPAKVYAVAMKNEKPGGHGDRASAVGALELAVWDLNAKLDDRPAYAAIAEACGRSAKLVPVPVYAAGGYYYGTGSGKTLGDELQGYLDLGFDAFKIKVGGATESEDLARIEEALKLARSGAHLAVDANGRFDLPGGLAFGRRIAPYNLRWYEEIGDPLDYALNQAMAHCYDGPIATGENLFSLQDVRNLLNFGGMRSGRDIFQMDAGLSYGLTEYFRILELLESRGFDRAQVFPHGGHLINLHIVAGLGLGGCEAYPGVFKPFGGYPDSCPVTDGTVQPSDAPGFGLEEKPEIAAAIRRLMA
ncbi:mandelate racemase [Sulfitobacter sp. F26204]|uniref:enolase C-terminal domain-like protein n=1 Tax=Sulfitobacter sp. F26204 TaxID=2996014 RepID=UPI00225E3D68|nr:enolase C-terminal domain-like protein [Sulfitobacter sp. F26204]MCX7560619.1 mandelate racemase [Sulfitobacter sp. F26204]